MYAELHCHSNFSFHDGASSIDELTASARELGYAALALTDHDNLCGAMHFARLARYLDLKAIIGAEVTLRQALRSGVSASLRQGKLLSEDSHFTLLARNRKGYSNLCRLLSYAHVSSERRDPQLDTDLLPARADGLVLLTGCRNGPIPRLLAEGRLDDAREMGKQYMAWFGPENVYVELQQNLVYGDTRRNRQLVLLARELGIGVAATNNVHYHIRERHQLQDALVAIKHCKSLEETHRERRPNSEFYLKSPSELVALFRDCPEAISNTLRIAGQCSFDLTTDLNYRFPDYPVPPGFTQESYLEHLCRQAAVRRYGAITEPVETRLKEEFRLIHKHNLAGFLLIYHDIIELARQIMVEMGLATPGAPPEENMPGRGRGSSVAMLVGYLIGLSHIDPLQYNLTLERFLPEDMANVPDIDLDFPRNIREELIKRVHEKWGWEHAVLSGMIDTYQIKGAVRDLGKALGLPPVEVDRLADKVDYLNSADVESEMARLPEFKDKVNAPVWADLVRLARELDGFPKYLAQHPGGMVISSTPITELVPVQRGAIDGRYICQWDKDSIDDAGFVKIDFLALGALSQLQEALQLVQKQTDKSIDISRINFDDPAVYDMLCNADTIGIFQVESAAQIQTIPRLRPRNLVDMAHEVGAVRPGVGVNRGVSQYLARRQGKAPVIYDHPLEKRALERTLGIILFQDQVNQVAIDVAGFGGGEADQLRRAFGRRHNQALLETYWQKFLKGALARGVDETAARTIFDKFNGQYMFPESHAFAFGVTAYQAAWLKHYYPLEFYVAIFNQQPMGFYNLETLKEDARRHGISVLNPDMNRSREKCIIDRDALRLGFLTVNGVGEAAAKAIVEVRERGPFRSLADVMERIPTRSGLQAQIEDLISAGAMDCFTSDRRSARWESGLRYRPHGKLEMRGERREMGGGRRGAPPTAHLSPLIGQLALPLPVEQDMAELPELTAWERMKGEYCSLGLFPSGHIMAHMRRFLKAMLTSKDILDLDDGAGVKIAGIVVRRQHPLAKAYFITLEDEFGHTGLVLWPDVYERYRSQIREPFLVVEGTVSRREGAMQVVVSKIKTKAGLSHAPKSKDWR
ncbi:MAG: DNA polymerase III subunit alpha [Chloroflexi bacterium]|nr:DNA polymerase III subunit alpha [Chloroflexota bacterium]